jgi:hypothetical protein
MPAQFTNRNAIETQKRVAAEGTGGREEGTAENVQRTSKHANYRAPSGRFRWRNHKRQGIRLAGEDAPRCPRPACVDPAADALSIGEAACSRHPHSIEKCGGLSKRHPRGALFAHWVCVLSGVEDEDVEELAELCCAWAAASAFHWSETDAGSLSM